MCERCRRRPRTKQRLSLRRGKGKKKTRTLLRLWRRWRSRSSPGSDDGDGGASAPSLPSLSPLPFRGTAPACSARILSIRCCSDQLLQRRELVARPSARRPGELERARGKRALLG